MVQFGHLVSLLSHCGYVPSTEPNRNLTIRVQRAGHAASALEEAYAAHPAYPRYLLNHRCDERFSVASGPLADGTRQVGHTGLDGTVDHLVAHLNTQTAQNGGIHRNVELQLAAVHGVECATETFSCACDRLIALVTRAM